MELMNAKLEELGLSDTAHFTNCVGLYDEAHSCTVTDMALILKAAMENDLCREVLSTHIYHTQPTAQHPEGQDLSNWFPAQDRRSCAGGLEVVGGKTGYVVQSGNCAASWAETSDGSRYLCVTGNAHSSWRAIYDHVALYTQYCLPETESTPVVTGCFSDSRYIKSPGTSDPPPGSHRTPGRQIPDILPVEIHHVSVGNAPLSGRLQQSEATAPPGRIYRHQPVVAAVEVLDNGIGHIRGNFRSGPACSRT